MRTSDFQKLLQEKTLVLDGAMGTMLISYGFPSHLYQIKLSDGKISSFSGFQEVLCLTAPEVVQEIHNKYIEAGADIITTNTFSANNSNFPPEVVREINSVAVQIARRAATRSSRKILIAGSIGPLPMKCSSVPNYYNAYYQQIISLCKAKVDILLFETVLEVSSLKTGLKAAHDVMQTLGTEIPIIVCTSLDDVNGCLYSGEQLSDLAEAVEDDPNVVSLGLNCCNGPESILLRISELCETTKLPLCIIPNNGLPDDAGVYSTPLCEFTKQMALIMSSNRVRIIGGCCGTTPDHIAALKKLTDKHQSI